MRMTLRTAVLPALTCALLVSSAAPATAAPAVFSLDLVAGESAGVTVEGGTVRLDHAATHLLPADADGALVPTGLLTLEERALAVPTDRVRTAVTADLPAGSTAGVDVRGQRPGGGWTEWVPAADGVAALPEPVSAVQGRLVLTGEQDVEPAVSDVTLAALPATRGAEAAAETAALNYRVFATREGLVGGTTANGHIIAERDHFVALPSRRALSPRNTSDYSVKVCAPNGRCAFAPVWDVGPWNTRDDYWNPAEQRQEWKDLPQGVPQAQAAHGDGYNGGRDQYDRRVANPAGIDLGDGLFWDALGLTDNSWVTVDYLWTGSVRLSAVIAEDPVDIREAPSQTADVVGVAAERASLPVECALTEGDRTWLRVGTDQYVAAEAVPDADAAPCAAPAGPPVDVPAAPADAAAGDPTAPEAGSGEPAVVDSAAVDNAAVVDSAAVVDTMEGVMNGVTDTVEAATADVVAAAGEITAATAGAGALRCAPAEPADPGPPAGAVPAAG